MSLISCETIQNICDIFLLSKNKTGILGDKNKIVMLDTINEIYNNPQIIFCFIDTFEREFIFLIKKLSLFKNKFVLVVNQSDYTFDQRYSKIFDFIPNLERIYTQNMNIIHDKIYTIPIGLSNSDTPFKYAGDFKLIKSIIKKIEDNIILKQHLIYFYFDIYTSPIKRLECYNKIIKKDIPFLERKNFPEYYNLLASYKFVISPEGNGIDCHRFWEALYVKTIPICKSNIIVNYYAKYFPIVILNDWDELDISKLEDIYNNADWTNYYKLDMNYITDIIYNSKAF
jgi:hypothetical protein